MQRKSRDYINPGATEIDVLSPVSPYNVAVGRIELRRINKLTRMRESIKEKDSFAA
jgi:hypothetical protein